MTVILVGLNVDLPHATLSPVDCNRPPVLEKVLAEYNNVRVKDSHAICDLAMDNYEEMRKSVNSKWFLLRKAADNFLHKLMPNIWVPLYTMVSLKMNTLTTEVSSFYATATCLT